MLARSVASTLRHKGEYLSNEIFLRKHLAIFALAGVRAVCVSFKHDFSHVVTAPSHEAL